MIIPLKTQSPLFRGMAPAEAMLRQGKVHNDGDVRDIDGFKVDVSGQAAVVAGPGYVPPKPIAGLSASLSGGLLAPSTREAVGRMVTGLSSGDIQAVQPLTGQDQSALAAPEAPLAAYQTWAPGLDDVAGFAEIPGEVLGANKELDWCRQQLARSGALSDIEARLSEANGQPVKVAFDPLAEEYLMLRPGQEGYDQVTSARDIYAANVREIGKLGYSRQDFAEVLSQHQVLA